MWLECPTGPSTADPNVLCQKAAKATDIRLRVLTVPVQINEDTVFGFTIHPVLATVRKRRYGKLDKSDEQRLIEWPLYWGAAPAYRVLVSRSRPVASESSDWKAVYGSPSNAPDRSQGTNNGAHPRRLVLDGLRNRAR